MAASKTNAAKGEEPRVRVRIPKTKENSGDVFVSVNERTWQIRRGVEVEVPECVAEVVRNSERAAEAALCFEEAARR